MQISCSLTPRKRKKVEKQPLKLSKMTKFGTFFQQWRVFQVLLQNVLPLNVLAYKTSFLQDILPQNVLFTKCPAYKTSMDTKRPWIQNVLLYKTSFPQNIIAYKMSLPTKRSSTKCPSTTLGLYTILPSLTAIHVFNYQNSFFQIFIYARESSVRKIESTDNTSHSEIFVEYLLPFSLCVH